MRKSLLEDYMISPNIVSQCSKEIQRDCGGMHRGGKTLHCLMDLTRPRAKQGDFAPRVPADVEMTKEISSRCEQAVSITNTLLTSLTKCLDFGYSMILMS